MFYFLILLPTLVFSSVVKDDVATTDRAKFPLSTVCKRLVTHESPLIEIVSGTEIDCMGKKVHVGRFCEKEMAHDPYYLRAFVDREKKEVVCLSGKKVIFKYQCVKLSDKDLCKDEARSSCLQIKEKLAYRLDIVHSSFTKNDKGIKELNCLFESVPDYEKFNGTL